MDFKKHFFPNKFNLFFAFFLFLGRILPGFELRFPIDFNIKQLIILFIQILIILIFMIFGYLIGSIVSLILEAIQKR